MKNNINHLPQIKQRELEKITEVILQNCKDVEKVLLYGSYARGDYREEKDLKPDRKSGHVSDYDILVITVKKRVALDISLWNSVSQQLHDLNLSASPRLLTIDIEALNIKLAEAQYFYSDITKEGIMLFDANNFALAKKRELSNIERQRIAQDHFDEWFLSAKEFFAGYEFYLKRHSLKKAAFCLHQAAESAYKALLLVFSNNCPSEHLLEYLGQNAEKYHKLMSDIFTNITREDVARFRLLEYAYIGGRYDPNYQISENDLKLLALDVNKLLELSKEACEQRIEGFGN